MKHMGKNNITYRKSKSTNANKEKKLKSIYIVLLKSNTLLSKAIHTITKDEYTHASISFDRELTQMYSFSRYYPYMMIPAGLSHEKLDGEVLTRFLDCKCALYEIKVGYRQFFRMRKAINKMIIDEHEYSFNAVGLVSCKLGIPLEFNHHFFCSQFVATILNKYGDIAIPKQPGLRRPIDFAHMRQTKCVYKGKLRNAV